MAARVSDRQKKKIIADYVDIRSYNAVGRLNNVSANTVKNIVRDNPQITALCEQKRQANTADVLEYMDSRKDVVCEIIGIGLEALKEPKKFDKATPVQITTALGILIDKWTGSGKAPTDIIEDDALSASLKELSEGLQSDDRFSGETKE